MSTSNGTHLTTSRVNRLFRPLRAKCTTLADFSAPRSHKRPLVSVTYSNRSRPLPRTASTDHDAPPLAILQPPESLGSRIHFDRTSLDNVQLSRKIYEVRDAFRSVVQAALGTESTGPRNDAPPIRSLASMCAAMIGENIQAEIVARQDELEDELEDSSTNITTDIQEELYEAVPLHYRSHTVISHALTLVLETCPHHPTLLTALLEVCLSHTLSIESHLVLHALFLESIRSSVTGSSTCPLLHPAHTNYLTTLRSSCCSRDHRASANYHRLDNSTFAALFVDALSQSQAGRVDAWTSKPVARLARDLRAQDLPAFLQLCSGLAHDIVETDKGQARSRSKRKSHVLEPLEDKLRPRLAKWTKSALDHLAARESQAESGDPAATRPYAEDVQHTVDFLLYISSTGLQVRPERGSPKQPSAADTLICLATYCLASPVLPTLPLGDRETLAAFLRSCAPNTDTYGALVGLFFIVPVPADPTSPFDFPLALERAPSEDSTPQPTPPPTPQLTQTEAMQVLRRYARALRAHRLYLLEASLWGNALRQIEDVILTGGMGGAHPFLPRRGAEAGEDLHALREELVGRVEGAEARCFSTGAGAQQTANAILGAGGPQAGPSTSSGEWVWEDMIGSWVQKTPEVQRPTKRRKVQQSKPLPAVELHAPRKLRSQSGPKKPERQPRRSQPGQATVASSSSRTSRQSTPTIVASPPHDDDDEETLASSEFEDFPGLSQNKKRVRRSPPRSLKTEKPEKEVDSAGEEDERRTTGTAKEGLEHYVQPRGRAVKRPSNAAHHATQSVISLHPERKTKALPKPARSLSACFRSRSHALSLLAKRVTTILRTRRRTNLLECALPRISRPMTR
ncbi:uncharacterized protein B0H18DRAFT_877604 [Fomitopsis serialis]|uniref:uncharacterized protein n=1 Tax=Fomitopsis serialis TaxID=139415 RepID=UPI0020083AC6|nr:uncharacterized protein B0H18DRAFT_877604 [Neoantrodia serialis]KAH9924906.1 hypothetical protein B0H18DRAFT_877604 [Neoantrodia serialis]